MKIRYIFIVLAALSGLVACAPGRVDQKPALTVSIPPQKWLLDRIVGDKFEVTALLSPGTNPETYDPSMNHLMNLQNSRAFFSVGTIGFEQASLDKIRQNFPNLKIYNSAEGINMLFGSHGHGDEADPHVWVSVRNAKIIASNMYRHICELDPDHKGYYRKNYDRLHRQLQQMDDSISEMLKGRQGESFLVWHPSLSYFARDYGLRQISVEADGKEAGPKQLQTKLQEAKNLHPTVFFAQKEYDTRQSREICDMVGIPLVPVSLMGGDWDAQIYLIASALAKK